MVLQINTSNTKIQQIHSTTVCTNTDKLRPMPLFLFLFIFMLKSSCFWVSTFKVNTVRVSLHFYLFCESEAFEVSFTILLHTDLLRFELVRVHTHWSMLDLLELLAARPRYAGLIRNKRAQKGKIRAREPCESQDGRPGLTVPNSSSYGLCGRKQHWTQLKNPLAVAGFHKAQKAAYFQ